MAFTTIDDPSQYFQTVLYTGDGNSTQAITNDGNSDLQPDWIWTKQRSHAVGHNLTDSSRGASKALFSESTDAEDTGGNISSFNSDGFTTTDANRTNQSGRTFVAWQWVANGGTTSSNSDGSITSTVQANTTAGFSIALWTGNATGGATIGHGLGAVPHWMIVKRRDGTADSWPVYNHKNTSAPQTDYLHLDEQIATTDSVDRWNDTAPTSTVVSLGDAGAVNGSGATYVGYFFTEKQGYSKFGSYIGNGSSEGAHVYTGFSPAWIMIKRTDSSSNGNWFIIDNKRTVTNPRLGHLRANQNNAENTSTNQSIDFLSNDFKLRDSNTSLNNGTYVYMAFAQSPFVSSKGVPATAR